jgi:hypothetical protein
MVDRMYLYPRLGGVNMIVVAKPKRTGTPLQIYVSKDTRAAIEQFIDQQRLPTTITDLGELAIQEFLSREGYWPYDPKKKPDDAD